MKRMTLKALAVAASLLSAGGASAATVTPLAIDTGWTAFAFGAVGTLAKKTYSFTLAGYALLTVTDGYISGDQFRVLANNVSRGLTSLPVDGASKVGNKWNNALANANFSSRSFRFGPGTYTISLLVNQRSGTDTANHLGAVRLDTAQVPVPAGGILLLSALGAAAAARRRKT